MKKLLLFIPILIFAASANAQDFAKSLASARASYGSGNLADARFAMEQMLAAINQGIGQQVLKTLPAQIGSMNYNDKQDNVSSSDESSGLYVNRTYGSYPSSAKIEITRNSPMLTALTAQLSNPMMGAMMHNDNQKVVKIQGYKSMLNKSSSSDGSKTSYELQIPMNNTLLSFKMDDTTEDQITNMANSLPIPKIASLTK